MGAEMERWRSAPLRRPPEPPPSSSQLQRVPLRRAACLNHGAYGLVYIWAVIYALLHGSIPSTGNIVDVPSSEAARGQGRTINA